MTAAFVVHPAITGMVMAYRNPTLIADEVLPRVPVGTKEFTYHDLPVADAFTVPNTLVGRKGSARQVEFGMTPQTGRVEDHGLMDVVPQDDIDQAAAMRKMGAVFDPEATAAQNLTDLVALGREVRTSALVFAAATYPVAQRTVLAGAAQWSDPASNPISAITDALDVPVMRPNTAVLGQRTWTRLRRNPALVKAASRSAGDSGIITQEEFKEMFELANLHVGQGFLNTAKPGQAATLQRVWGNHASFIYKDPLATTAGQRATFGITAQFGNRVAQSRFNGGIGLKGAVEWLVGESVDELITAPACGYFFENAVA